MMAGSGRQQRGKFLFLNIWLVILVSSQAEDQVLIDRRPIKGEGRRLVGIVRAFSNAWADSVPASETSLESLCRKAGVVEAAEVSGLDAVNAVSSSTTAPSGPASGDGLFLMRPSRLFDQRPTPAPTPPKEKMGKMDKKKDGDNKKKKSKKKDGDKKMGKGGKGKIPICGEGDGGVPPTGANGNPTVYPGLPPSSPAVSPAGGDGGLPSAPGTPTSPGVPTTGAPPASPSVSNPAGADGGPAPAPSFPSAPVPPGSLTVCQAFQLGLSPTAAPSQSYDVGLTLIVDSISSTILDDVRDVLQAQIAPRLLGCQRRRFLQAAENSTLVNMLFNSTTTNPDNSGGCDNVVTGFSCVVLALVATAYGNVPQGFADTLKTAIEKGITDGLFSSIAGLRQILFVASTQIQPPSASPVLAPSSRGVPTVSPRSPSGISAIQSGTGSSTGGTISPAGYVGIAVGGLILAFLALFALTRRSDEGKRELQHRQITEDEDDAEIKQDDEVPTSGLDRRIHIIGEEQTVDSGQLENIKSGNQEVYLSQSVDEVLELHDLQSLESHSCSSPTCELCEIKRRTGVRFVPTSGSASLPATKSKRFSRWGSTRDYMTADTVTL